MLNKKIWLILGGTGQLGRSLQEHLIKNGIKFIAPSSSILDIRDYQTTRNYILLNKPSVVVNCAGWTNVNKAESDICKANVLNGFAVDNLIKTCQEMSVIFVHISTDYVFSGSKKSPYFAYEEVNPINAYGASKVLGEKFIKESRAEKYYIFRTAWLYSEFGSNFVKTIITKRRGAKGEIKVVNDQFGNPTFASDLAFQIIQSINLEIPYGIYHAVNSGVASWYDLAMKVAEYSGYESNQIRAISSRENMSEVQRPLYTSLDSTKWSDVNIPEMRSWQKALEFAMPRIIKNI
jgi:dTDP-4-dehydrorhamnose reductase